MTIIDEKYHGTTTGYAYGCRCDLCREAAKLQSRSYRERNKEASQERERAWYLATRDIRIEQSKKRRDSHKDFLSQIKLESGCVECGFNEHPDALDFDHIPERGPKIFEIGRCRTYSIERLLLEIAKCEVVCANCHRIRTAERRNGND